MTTQTRGLTKILLVAGIAILLMSQMVLAAEIGDGVDLSGQMRWRMEFDDRDFVSITPLIETSYLRTRVNLKVTSIENTTVYFQMQDSRNLGINSSGLTNDTNLGVHQGYIKLDNAFMNNLSLQVGRFEAVYGRHRLMGNVGWSNIGRSFDGIRFGRTGNSYKADIFALKVVERGFGFPGSPAIPATPPDTGGTPGTSPIPSNDKDQNLYGVYSTFMEGNLDFFVLYDWDQMKTGDDYDLARFTIGSYFKNKFDSGLGYVFDAAYQMGKMRSTDIAAFMVAGDIYYKMDSKLSKVGVGFDITSGDDPETADKFEAFNNLYYTGHKFRGFMDFFVPNQNDGLMDLMLRAAIKPCEKGAIIIDIHHFQTMQDHDDASDMTTTPAQTKAIGQEIDITIKRTIADGIGFQGGLSAFMAADEFIFEADNAYWFYLMLTAGF